MASIPVVLVQPLRQALVSQGFPAETVRNDGTINAAGFLAGSYDTIQIRTTVTPDITIDTAELLKERGAPSPMSWVKPTIVLSGRGGTSIIAPYGPASSGGWVVPFAVAGLLIGVGVLLGRATA